MTRREPDPIAEQDREDAARRGDQVWSDAELFGVGGNFRHGGYGHDCWEGCAVWRRPSPEPELRLDEPERGDW